MGWFDSFFNPDEGFRAGQDQLDKYYQEGQNYLKPYSEVGQTVQPHLLNAMQRLLDPTALEGDWTKAYSTSPAALQAEKMAQERGLNAANAMGLGGSNTALRAIQEGTSQIGMQDRENWLNRLLQKYTLGTGIGQNLFNTGAGAASTMATNATNMGNNSAQLAYGEQEAPGNALSSLIGGVAAPALGWLAGGPVGAAAGSKLSHWLFGGKK